MRVLNWIKANIITNLCAFLLFLSSPIKWTSPFGVAFLAAAGHGEMKWDSVFLGSALGALIGKGGFGGLAGGLMAYTLCGIFNRRDDPRPKSKLSLTAFACCLFPALAYHLPYSAYDTVAATFASVIAMAACPAISPVCMSSTKGKMHLNKDERVAWLILCAVMIAGVMELYAPAGCFFAGLFALLFSFGGLFSALIGALTAVTGLLIGSAAPNECALVFLSSAAAGALARYGQWAQSGMFLIGIPLSAYFGFHINSACILLSAAVYPWIPSVIPAQISRSFGFYDEMRQRFLTARTARRHIAPSGMKVCGDAGLVEHLPGGRMIFMLADGMGTGKAAREMSERVIGHVKNVFQSPLNADEAMVCVNALSKEEKEMHAAVDICLLDTVTGRAEFIKNGAEPCWILSRYESKRIEGEALPVGALHDAPNAKVCAGVKPGDSIFMATDGLLNALGGADQAEKILIENKGMSPAALCSEMIKRAKSAPAIRKKDDMSAMCIKIGGKSAYSRAIERLPKAKEEREGEKKAG